ncbi:MAG: type II and III secretion system protein family protein [Rhodospirillales bacterium]|nr:type II and III secretion system protein family protein [Rhodospirillales bacterium]
MAVKRTITGRTFLALVAVVAVLAFATGAMAAAVKVTKLTGTYAGELAVPLNKSLVLETDVAFGRVSVGNSEITDVLPLSDRTIYVLGKQVGLTNLTIYSKEDRPLAVLDVSVVYDVQSLKSRLNELFPGQRIEIRSTAGSLVLSGRVSDAVALDRILAVAQQYAPNRVTNLLTVRGSQQVMLAVKFAEISRSLSRNLGIKPSLTVGGNPSLLLAPLAPGAAGSLITGLLSTSGDVSLDLLIEALETKGLVKTLAEPNLIAMSGDTASFLAGGEFPVPVAQEATGEQVAITVEFKEFGVGLSFTPTVLADGLMNLIVKAEVSALDTSTAGGAVTAAGFEIPALVTRRAETTIELRDGQSFAIAGLFQDNFANNVSQLPWIGDVPILGLLFRSADFQKSQTELVIIVTPHLVTPGDATAMTLPTDAIAEPTDLDLFFYGRTEAHKFPTAVGPSGPTQLMQLNKDGGVSGDYGYIIE